MVGLHFALAFGVLGTLGQVVAYARGMRPSTDYAAAQRPRITARQFWGTVVRLLGCIATALVCSALVGHVAQAWWFALRTGITTGVGILINSFIEYYADNLPKRRQGAFGIGLILCGFTLQSFQYWLALLDVRLT
jgi:hypothetical protein